MSLTSLKEEIGLAGHALTGLSRFGKLSETAHLHYSKQEAYGMKNFNSQYFVVRQFKGILDLILKRARDNMPELLIPQQIELLPGTLLHVFSQNAFDILSESEIPKQVTLVRSNFSGYLPEQVEIQTWQALRESVLTGNTTTPFIFDAVRKRS